MELSDFSKDLNDSTLFARLESVNAEKLTREAVENNYKVQQEIDKILQESKATQQAEFKINRLKSKQYSKTNMFSDALALKVTSDHSIIESGILFPVHIGYSLKVEVNDAANSETPFELKLAIKYPTIQIYGSKIYSSEKEALTSFILNEDENLQDEFYKLRDFVIFTIRQIKYFNVTEQSRFVISEDVIHSGEDWTKEQYGTVEFVEFFKEYEIIEQRKKVLAKEIFDSEAKEKSLNNFKQWEWLEKKRISGEFNQFLSNEQ